MDNEVTVVRIYLREADHGKRKTLMQEVFNILHDQQRVQSLVVFRGIAGFGDSGEVHAVRPAAAECRSAAGDRIL